MPDSAPAMMAGTLSKLGLWLAAIAFGTVLLHRRQVSARVRLAFVLGGMLLFGFLFGIVLPAEQDPNPVMSLRGVMDGLLGPQPLFAPSTLMLALLLVTVFVSNKSVCGWGCSMGLLQDLLSRVRFPKWHPPFWLSNSIRGLALAGLVGGSVAAQTDWISYVDPFRLFQLSFTPAIVGFSLIVLAVSLFVFRPWCQFLCPFGFLGWIVEQASLMHPRVDHSQCKNCRLCVKACPTGAMNSFLMGDRIHADCFACGACIEACRVEGAIRWG